MKQVVSIYFSMRRLKIIPCKAWKFAIGQGIKLSSYWGNVKCEQYESDYYVVDDFGNMVKLPEKMKIWIYHYCYC